MKFASGTMMAAAMILAAGCATPGTRIQTHQAEFDAWPAAVQAKVRAGQVEVGFTPEMVRVALGEPDRVHTRLTEKGQSEVWIYFDHGPHVSIGLGVGVGNRRSDYAAGAAVDAGPAPDSEEVLRVIFKDGRVSEIESKQ